VPKLLDKQSPIQGASGSNREAESTDAPATNREAESTDAPARGGLLRSSSPPAFTDPVPKDFNIEVYASGVDNARSLRIGDNGTVFVGSRLKDKVHAIVDTGGKREV
jgi:hypothetical protein